MSKELPNRLLKGSYPIQTELFQLQLQNKLLENGIQWDIKQAGFRICSSNLANFRLRWNLAQGCITIEPENLLNCLENILPTHPDLVTVFETIIEISEAEEKYLLGSKIIPPLQQSALIEEEKENLSKLSPDTNSFGKKQIEKEFVENSFKFQCIVDGKIMKVSQSMISDCTKIYHLLRKLHVQLGIAYEPITPDKKKVTETLSIESYVARYGTDIILYHKYLDDTKLFFTERRINVEEQAARADLEKHLSIIRTPTLCVFSDSQKQTLKLLDQNEKKTSSIEGWKEWLYVNLCFTLAQAKTNLCVEPRLKVQNEMIADFAIRVPNSNPELVLPKILITFGRNEFQE